ncbi:mannose/fructose-specific PTS system IIA component [Ligilactobacillus agilis]|uniref:Mannose/fructose-specific PTS system IIA component n=1 Tax=Ligilactobacillus agilis TaxID=1601 RepID=A0A6F9Y2Y4_9LACO|nr:PTS fructose transporter subunit IIA [Ligilactobacillus agilis]GET11921.1 mannose/fructose-specific PTS system IIA component [Ligilactobacillus agilis]
MTDILIASHGHMASGMKSSIEILTGMGAQIVAVDAYVDESDYLPEIRQFIKNATGPAVIFTDLLGGSVNQKVILECDHQNIFIVSQMNLAIVMAVLLDTEELTTQRLQELIKQSQVQLVTTKLDNSQTDDEDFFA